MVFLNQMVCHQKKSWHWIDLQLVYGIFVVYVMDIPKEVGKSLRDIIKRLALLVLTGKEIISTSLFYILTVFYFHPLGIGEVFKISVPTHQECAYYKILPYGNCLQIEIL